MSRKSTQVEKTCRNCGATFRTKAAWAAERKYCSKTCMTAYERQHGREAAQAVPIEFACKQCGKPFFMKPAYLAEYQKKFGRTPLYCSIPCSAKGRRTDTEARSTFVCKQCGKTNPMRRYEMPTRTKYDRTQIFCDQRCKSEFQRSEFHRRFAEGAHSRRIKRGYVVIRIPTAAGEPRREMLEHRYVMEQFLGRPLLPTETVHHRRAWDKTCNEMENLELRTGNHGPGGAVEDVVRWCAEMLTLYHQFVPPGTKTQIFAALGARISVKMPD